MSVFRTSSAATAIWIGAACLGCAEPVVIPDMTSCRTCEIKVTEQVRIGEADGPGSLVGRPTYLALDSLGRFWVSMLDYGFPYVYAADGSFIQQFGEPGDGPGEFRNAWVVEALPGDSVLLSAGLSYLVVTPELSIARRITRAPQGQLTGLRVQSWPDDVLGLSIAYGSATQTSHVQHLDFSGDRVAIRSEVAPAAGSTADIFRRVEPDGRQAFWVSEVARYSLRRYAQDGTVLDSLKRTPNWFPPADEFRPPSPTQSPSASVTGFQSDPEGRLWVFLDRPRPDWLKAWGGQSFPSGAVEVRVSALPPGYELWSTVIEVIDIDRRRILARHELDGQVFAVLAHDLVATYVELETGIPVVTVHRLALVES